MNNEKLINAFNIFERKVLKGNKLIVAPIVVSLLFLFIGSVSTDVDAVSLSWDASRLSSSTVVEQKHLTFKENSIDLHTSVRWWKYNQAVTVYKPQVQEMIARWYSRTRILDILGLKNMECHQYNGDCVGMNFADYWPFQINRIHKEIFDNSLKYRQSEDRSWLFRYQLTYANELVESYDARFCWEHIFKQIGRTYTNENRFKCVAVSYNGSPRYKHTYKKIAWLKRQIISDWAVKNINNF